MTPIEDGLVAVVDDDASTLSALWRLLALNQYHVKTFGTAEELLRSGVLDQLACLVTDIHLGPGMSGLELSKALRERGLRTAFVFMSGSADEETQQLAREAGGIAFLEKPISAELLVETVAKALHSGR